MNAKGQKPPNEKPMSLGDLERMLAGKSAAQIDVFFAACGFEPEPPLESDRDPRRFNFEPWWDRT